MGKSRFLFSSNFQTEFSNLSIQRNEFRNIKNTDNNTFAAVMIGNDPYTDGLPEKGKHKNLTISKNFFYISNQELAISMDIKYNLEIDTS